MSISGPCHVLYRDGKPDDSYLVTATQTTMIEIHVTSFYFKSKDEAELYVKYLQQVEGLKDIDRLLASKKIPEYEKEEYRQFLKTLEPEVLQKAVSKLTPEIVISKYRRKKTN